MTPDYDGSDVIDATGERIGTVEKTYVDDKDVAKFVGIKMGGLISKHRLVPVDRAETTKGQVRVLYDKDTIAGSPDASLGETLEGNVLDKVRSYYASRGTGRTGVSGANKGRAAGGVQHEDEPGIGERIREKLPGGTQSDDKALEASEAGMTGGIRDLGNVIEVPIVEEVTIKKPVVKEVLRIRKRQITEERTVGGEVRKEDVEITREGDDQAG